MRVNFPEAFESAMRTQLSDAYGEFCEAHNTVPPVSVRMNPCKHQPEQGTPVGWCKMGRYLPARPSFIADPRWHSGAYYVQEASTMFLERALTAIGTQGLRRVLDLCAAPGGKSTHLLSLIPEDAVLISNEVIRSRASVLSENIQRWGYPNAMVTSNDPADFTAYEGLFDLILVDAPCSGEGLFRRDPAAMRHWSPENVMHCASRQQRILHDVWPSLARGGHLIYCTCTYNREENEKNLKTFSTQYDMNFVSIPVKPEWKIEEIDFHGVIGYRFYPHKADGEGFFLCIMRKKKGVEFSQKISTKAHIKPIPSSLSNQLMPWFKPGANLQLIQKKDAVIASTDVELLEFTYNHFRVVIAGTPVASLKREKVVPQPALAMSAELNHQAVEYADLSLEQAHHFLKREPLSLQTNAKGIVLARYGGLGLGWMNILPNRINNLYPQRWRIVKSITEKDAAF